MTTTNEHYYIDGTGWAQVHTVTRNPAGKIVSEGNPFTPGLHTEITEAEYNDIVAQREADLIEAANVSATKKAERTVVRDSAIAKLVGLGLTDEEARLVVR